MLGPEAFQVYKGDLYTSLATGEIVKVSPGGHVTFVTKIGQPCCEYHNILVAKGFMLILLLFLDTYDNFYEIGVLKFKPHQFT